MLSADNSEDGCAVASVDITWTSEKNEKSLCMQEQRVILDIFYYYYYVKMSGSVTCWWISKVYLSLRIYIGSKMFWSEGEAVLTMRKFPTIQNRKSTSQK